VPGESLDDPIYVRRHLRVGWWSFFLFASFGLFLESLQGFKIRAYLDVSNETRRLMWTLAHAHGALLVPGQCAGRLEYPNHAGGWTRAPEADVERASRRDGADSGRILSGGVVFYGGDPGLGVLILPIGAVAQLFAALLLARAAGSVSAAAAPYGPRGTATKALRRVA
jgi:hypothetical protein